MNDSLFVSIVVFLLVGHVIFGIYFMFRTLMKKDTEDRENINE